MTIQFSPNEENEMNKFLLEIKAFGKIVIINNMTQCFNDSLIIGKNQIYINTVLNWIKSNTKIKTELLYRKSRDGDSYDSFHKMCDNKGKTLVLIKCREGNIIGGYTPLDWDNHSDWKIDDETFLFSLNKNKKYTKKGKSKQSILCSKSAGPWFPFFGFFPIMEKRIYLKVILHITLVVLMILKK